MKPTSPSERARRADAFLRAQLCNGPAFVHELVATALSQGLNKDALRDAKARLGVVAIRERDRATGRTRAWRWQLPPRGKTPPSYPTYRFHASGQQRRVENAMEDAALGPDWYDAPPAPPKAGS